MAVKVVRPGVRERFARDLAGHALRRAPGRAPRAATRSGCGRSEVVETLARSVAIEMDLRLEAAAVSELAENMRDDPDFRVPRPTGT